MPQPSKEMLRLPSPCWKLPQTIGYEWSVVTRAPPLRSGKNSLADVRLAVQLPGSSDTATSFQLEGEDHTLGNALRYIIMKK